MTFERFIEKKYDGLNFIPISTEEYLPGAILNKEERIVDHLKRVFHLEDPKKWSTKKVNATIAGEKVIGERSLNAGATLLGVFSLKNNTKSNYAVSFEFNEVASVVFDTSNGGVYENEIRNMIDKLKADDKRDWKDVLHTYIVTETIYVEKFSASFKKDGRVMAAAEVEQLKNEVNVNADYQWSSAGVIEIVNNKTPFGVRGFSIKRL